MEIQQIFDECSIKVTRFEPVQGGDINRAFCLYAGDERFFLKVNGSKLCPGMFEKEAEGLNALRKACNLKVPQVIKYGEAGVHQYLLLEWIDTGQPDTTTWQNLGMALANMHKHPQPYFGWENDNYIGSLSQENTPHHSWSEFYTHCRIMPLVKQLYNTGSFSKDDVLVAEHFCNRLHELFPEEKPALLHGDLWNGNYLITANSEAALIDPAVYCGHREMDIGMTKLFGGFDRKFYETYHEAYPLEKKWESRISYAQVYPLLVHAVLFGGQYARRAANAMLL